MEYDLAPAIAFGTLLRENPGAAKAYDSCTREERNAILAQLHTAPDVAALVAQLEKTAP